jgi:Tfp pilus assembly protein PilF
MMPMTKSQLRPRFALLAALFAVACAGPAAPADAQGAASARAASLRNEGIGHLENEKPAEAEEVFRRLAEVAGPDPLPWANLAIAQLRQQKTDEALASVERALGVAPGRADLLAIQGEILSWVGRMDEALAVLDRAVAAAPRDVETVYQLYRTATTASGAGAERSRDGALARLVELRPENVVVLLERGRRAIETGDRAAATGAYQRVGELLWQTPQAEELLAAVLAGLASGDVAQANTPARRLENVLKVSPMYQQSLRELWTGIVGIPVMRFAGERRTVFGEPLKISFRGERLSDVPTLGRALAVADFDGDGRPDIARLRGGDSPGLEVRLSGRGYAAGRVLPVRGLGAGAGAPGLLAVDLDDDGHRDLLAYGPSGMIFWKGDGKGGFADATAAFGLASGGGSAAATLDFDIEGDLDLVVAGGAAGVSGAPRLYRNALSGPLEEVGRRVLPSLRLKGEIRQIIASDLDRDGDLDLVILTSEEIRWVDNLRQGRFVDRTAAAGLSGAGGGWGIASADLDNDGRPDLVVVRSGAQPLAFFHNRGGTFRPWNVAHGLPPGPDYRGVIAFDADNDGRLDLAVAGEPGRAGGPAVAVLGQRSVNSYARVAVSGAPSAATAVAAADLDGDGDLDLVAAGPGGLHRFTNQGGNGNNWLAVRLRGLSQGSGKNNVFGAGSVVEVWDDRAYQFREADGDVTWFGLGKRASADMLRVVWPNGVPQDRLAVAADQLVVEEQVLKGSCPFLYTWDGERMAFVTDLLWGSPIGLPVAEGVWAGADPSELVRVDGAAPRDGRYLLKVTEELWEAAFFDHLRLWVVDHPADVEVASSLRILPGHQVADEVLASRQVRPVVAAWDGRGRDATAAVAARDDVYADGYRASRFQGIAAEPWALTFDLGEAPGGAVRLHLDGWIFPSDASLNVAVSQRPDGLAPVPPRLEVETADGWQVLMPEMGFPAGKTKTMVVDTPPLPAGASKLRIVTQQWLGWDRVAWTTAPADDAARVVARLDPERADLAFRGFSKMTRVAPNGPHAYDYAATTTVSPWLPFPGRYTRYGDVRELLAAVDDRSVILGPGDEIDLAFDASALPAPPAGWRRTVFLESHGWDKDADRNTWEPQSLEPLPFRAMSGYPYGPDESFPDTPLHRRYLDEWLTRVVEPAAPGEAPGEAPTTAVEAAAASAAAAP